MAGWTAPADLPEVDVMQFEALAREKLSKMAYDYIRTGGADEITARENRLAFERLRLKARVLMDVSEIDTQLSLLGTELEFPILLAPVACQRLYHPEGEVATARGASAAGAAIIVSSLSNTPIEDISRNTQSPVWFQLYMQRDRGFTRSLVERAVAAGSKAICLTVDAPVLGCRYGQTSFSLPKGIDYAHLRGLNFNGSPAGQKKRRSKIYEKLFEPSLNWSDLVWLRSAASVPLLLKGILNPEDAARALEEGIDGLIVSNHGGRNLDTAPAAIEALPGVVEAVAGRIPILLDSGIRRGTDVLAALALGAKAVLIGRPYAYALATGGAAGVERVIHILREEFERAMALTGRRSLSEIDSSLIWARAANPVSDPNPGVPAI
ncbi:MAG: alpha-hydroxy acid oxidase [Candidatus Acidiferrales bacterium]